MSASILAEAADDEPAAAPRPAWRLPAAAALVALGALSLLVIYSLTYQRAVSGLTREAQATAQLQVAVLESELDKQRSTPVILADDSDVIRAVSAPSPERSLAISRKLERLQREIRSAAIYLIDAKGVTLSASNYALPVSFVGSDYRFRAYFSDALATGQAEQFALGTVSHRPGLYIAHRVEAGGRVLGVVVVKVEFDAIEQAWARAGARTIVTDRAGHILLTSVPALRFHAGPRVASSEILTSVAAPAPGWRLHFVTSRLDADRAARAATLMAAMGEALLLTLVAWLRRRRRQVAERAAAETRYREKLERNVALRTQELTDANARLSAEIHERQEAERRLNVLQADLVQANKLAQLGQITAGVAHEINQPLAAIRAFAENAQTLLGRAPSKTSKDTVETNLGAIVRLSERIGHITGELRTFSRKARGESEPVSLKETIDSSVLLNRSRLRDNRVKLVRQPVDPQLKVIGGRIRLEQVLVNLLQNAFEALEETPDPVVRISIAVEEEWVRVRISDNGPGLSPKVAEQLFTPFVTTKEKGLGLGLVIAHDILRDFGGELGVEKAPAGATFVMKLRKVRA